MKKYFNYALVALAAAALCMVSCKKDPTTGKTDNTEEPGNTVEEYAGPTQGTSAWSVIGNLSALGNTDWTADFVMAESGDAFVLKNVKLTAADEFKFRKDKDWTVNFGGSFAALGQAFTVSQNGDNIKPALDGIYDLYLNANTAEAAVVAKDGAAPTWTEKTGPEASSWDYVLNTSDYKVNSEFHFYDNPVKINPSAFTFQAKFFATEWHDYGGKRTVGDEEYSVWCNRLGQIGDRNEQGILIRFNDGGDKGSLRLNSSVFGLNNYVTADGEKMYIFSLNEWHVLTLTADGTNVCVYDNGELIQTIAQNTGEVWAEWPIERFDISMTWDDGTGYPRGQAFLGYYAYTRVWSKTLSQSEIAASLCDVTDTEGLEIYWTWNLDSGTTVANKGAAAGYDADFTKALAAGQQNYVKGADVEGAWTDVTEIENGTVCAE